MKYSGYALALTFAFCASRADSQTFTTLLSFTGTGGTASGAAPYGSLTVSGTSLFGMTVLGGVNRDGNIFSVGTDGTNFQNLLSFTGTGGAAIGANPYGSLTLTGTTLYGMTSGGGTSGYGNVFSVGTSGANYQNLLSLTGNGGAAIGRYPRGNLTLSGTTLYGMSYQGGFNGYGNVFSVGGNGTNYQNLISFVGSVDPASGQEPFGSLTLSGTMLYGMSYVGGANHLGNAFSIGTNGTNYQNRLSFTGTSGAASGQYPNGNLTLSGTTLYGMTYQGGANGFGNVFSVGTDGTGYHNLLSFTGTGGAASGANPEGSLTLSGTTLYGLAYQGGAKNKGAIFSVGIDGSGYHSLFSFTGSADGGFPLGDLTLSSGTLFGMTNAGGINNNGTVFALTLPTPEPGTLALAGSAAAALVAYRWRRRRC